MSKNVTQGQFLSKLQLVLSQFSFFEKNLKKAYLIKKCIIFLIFFFIQII